MELLIKNGTIASSEEIKKADLYIKDEKIVEIIDFADLSKFSTAKIIDASNKLIIPGGIDVHTHLNMPFMGTFSVDDFETGTKAAIYGGVTSIIDYIIPQKNQSLQEALKIWQKKAENKAYIDYGFHMAIVPPINNILEEFEYLINQGITSIKCFLAYKNALMIEDKDLIKIFKKAKELNILVCIHAEDGNEIDLITKQLLSENKTQPIHHAVSRPAELEVKAIEKIINLAKNIDIPIYFVHLSTKEGMKKIEKAKAANQIIYTETCPQYLLLTEDEYAKPGFEGAKYVMSPPLRSLGDKNYLSEALCQQKIDIIATDHCPFNFSTEKQLGINDFTKIPNGIPAIENRMSLMFNKMVIEQKLPVTEFVKLNSTNPAKIFGLKNKGDIKIGLDADILIWNPCQNWIIKSNGLHHNVDYSPFENFTGKGIAETVILRGNILLENNIFQVKKGFGQYLTRKS